MQPYSGEFNTRPVSFEVGGLQDFTAMPVAIDMMTGESFDLPVKFENGKATVTGAAPRTDGPADQVLQKVKLLSPGSRSIRIFKNVKPSSGA